MGYKPDWQNQSAKKPAGYKCSPGIQSRELFHGAKKAMMKYADGGEVADLPELREPTEADTGTPTSAADLPELREPTAADRGEAKPAAPQKFGDAFKSARSSGAKDFEWNGKKYTTQLASEVKAPAKASAPAKVTEAPKGEIEDTPFMKPGKGVEAGYKVDAARAEYKASRDAQPGLSKGRAAIDANKADQAAKKAALRKAQADYEAELGDEAKPYIGYRRR